SHGQTEQSIEGQLHDNYAWAQQQGVTVIAEYVDRALTGTKDQRPDFQRMIEDAAKQQFQMVIVWKLDRFARNRYDSAIYKARLKKYGVRVVSVKEAITDSPEGIILEGLLESMAEYYSANLSQNVRRGIRESVDKGYYPGGSVPYGYKSVDHRLVLDEKTAPVIRYVFEEYAKGVDKKTIIDELNRRGVRNSRGKPLCYTSFQHALRMTTYIGEYTYQGKQIPCAEPLVSRELFDKVQARLDQKAHAPAAAKAHVPYLLQGKAYCGPCGAPMFGESGKSHTGKLHTYYCCYNRKRKKGCRKVTERKEDLETLIVTRTMEYILTPSRMKSIASAVVQEYNREFSDSRVEEWEKAAAQIDRELEKLVDALIDAPKVAHKKIYDRMEQLEAQKAEYETDIAKLRVAMGLRLTEKDVISWLATFRDKDPSQPEFRARLIDIFVNSAFIYDDRIVVFYNIRGGRQVTHRDLLETLDAKENSKPELGSDLELPGGPPHSKSEPCYVFVRGVFGCIFYRER
ncbi:MAG: recombinase family protein, partial [Clostridia bacterium]|nr:recombinase family protein [Clostridia bacterium]